jgi:hypothetical protein
MSNQTHARNRFRWCAAAASAAVASLAWVVPADAQLYRNSVVATDFDFITESDPSVFEKLEYVGKQEREMADKRPNTPDDKKQAYVFQALFSDNTRVVVLIDAAFESLEAARTEAMRYVHPLGKLPTSLRGGIRRALVVHKGGEDTTAFSDPGLISVYSDNATKRIGTHDLEETIFHESVHASWDRKHARSEEWKAAQAKDGAFVTEYAAKKPKNEDLAESALFAYTLLHHPERIPADDAKRIRELIPNRIAYIAQLLPPDKPIFVTVKQSDQPVGDGSEWCTADISLSGVLADILSNALRIDFKTESDVLRKNYDDSESLFQAVVTELKIEPEKLKQSIRRHLHVNCKHGPTDDSEELEELAKWKAPRNESASAQPSRIATREDAAVSGAPQAEMINVVSELRWISRILILGVFSNVVLIALHFYRPKAK